MNLFPCVPQVCITRQEEEEEEAHNTPFTLKRELSRRTV
jgi:hypothetical protein